MTPNGQQDLVETFPSGTSCFGGTFPSMYSWIDDTLFDNPRVLRSSADALAMAGTSAGAVQVFKSNGAYYFSQCDSEPCDSRGTWSSPGAFLSGGSNLAPAIAVEADGTAEVAVPQGDGVYILHNAEGAFLGNTNIGGICTSPAAIDSRPGTNPSILDVVCIGTDQGVWINQRAQSSWAGWYTLSGPADGGGVMPGVAPAVVSTNANTTLVFVVGANGQVYYRAGVGGSGWSPWYSLGGTNLRSVAAASYDPNRIDVVAIDSSGKMQHRVAAAYWTQAWTQITRGLWNPNFAPFASYYSGKVGLMNVGGIASAASVAYVQRYGDYTVPRTTITSPVSGATFAAPANITINATASSVYGGISKVDLVKEQAASIVGTATTAPYSFAWTHVPAGNYRIFTEAFDDTGSSGRSTWISLTVNPVIASPANGATFTAPANITINATATDSAGTISKVEFYQGATLLGAATTFPYSYTWSNVAASTYSLTAMVYDSVNGNTTSAPVTITVNAPNQAPTVSITSPSNGATFTAPASITINATASDSDGTISKVEFYQGATLLSTATTSPYSYTWSNVAAGTYGLTAKAYDNLNAITTSTAVSVTVSANKAPTVSVTSPSNGATFTAPASITINATASDSDGTISKVEFYQGSTLLGTDTTSPYSYTWSSVAAGTYSLTAKAYDNLNATTTSTAVSVTVSGNKAPTVSITSPAHGATFTAPASITMNATASDSDGTISKVEFYRGSTLLGTDTTSPYSYTWSSVAAGTYSLTAKAYDNLNATTTSTAVSVTVSGNKAPTVSITSPANGATFTAPASITINATASDSDGTISKVEFYQGSTLLGTDTTSPYSYTWSNVAAGTYSLTAKAYDNLNASTTSTAVSVTVSSSGSRPCTGLCSNPVVFTSASYQSGSLGTGATCHETTASLAGGNCSNMGSRTLKVNNTTMSCSGWSLPAKRNGGYCIQATAGTPDYAAFATW
jgi:Bacterial Ig domain